MNEEYTQRGIGPLFAPPGGPPVIWVKPLGGGEQTCLFGTTPWRPPPGVAGSDREQFYSSPYLAQLPMDFTFPARVRGRPAAPQVFGKLASPLLAAMPRETSSWWQLFQRYLGRCCKQT